MFKKIFIRIIFIFFVLNLFSSIYSTKQNININKLNSDKIQIFTGVLKSKNFLGDIFDDDDDEDDFVTKDKNCNKTEYPEQAEKCDLKHMECTNMVFLHHCSCKGGYITFPKNNSIYCNLVQKKQSIAFILEFCVGFGAGHFYRHDYTMGSLKLVAFVFGIVFICSFPITAKYISDCNCDCIAVLISIIYYLYLCALTVWYFWDLIYFGKNKYKDLSNKGKSVPLKHW